MISASANSIGRKASKGAIAAAQRSASAPPRNGRSAQDQPGERQIDQPRPVDVGAAVRGVEPVLDEVEPVLPAEQVADLRHAQIVVGIAKREAADLAPFR